MVLNFLASFELRVNSIDGIKCSPQTHLKEDLKQAKGLLRLTYVLLGWFFLGLGLLGSFLPILPTTPFLLLAIFFFSKSSKKWHGWILNHQIFGPPIQRWQEKHAVKSNVKVWAISVLVFSFSISIYLICELIWLTSGLLLLFAILLFFLMRLPVNDEPLASDTFMIKKKHHG